MDNSGSNLGEWRGTHFEFCCFKVKYLALVLDLQFCQSAILFSKICTKVKYLMPLGKIPCAPLFVSFCVGIANFALVSRGQCVSLSQAMSHLDESTHTHYPSLPVTHLHAHHIDHPCACIPHPTPTPHPPSPYAWHLLLHTATHQLPDCYSPSLPVSVTLALALSGPHAH